MPVLRETRYAVCHPDRVHHCKDLCKDCYIKAAHARRMQDPAFRASNVARSRKWALANPERAYLLDANKHLQRRFGITYAEYQKLLEKQGGACAICKKPETIKSKKRITRLAVDHCHTTGKIRGILCFKCNTSIGLVENNPELLNNIKNYLEGKNV